MSKTASTLPGEAPDHDLGGDGPPRFGFVEKLGLFPGTVRAVMDGDLAGALSVVYLDLNTDICNHACHFCDGYYRPLQSASIPAERLYTLVDEFADLGVQAVVIAGDRGEPFMHPAAAQVIAHLISRGIEVGAYTNGTALSAPLRDVVGGMAWLRVSADAGSAETHRLMHVYRAGRRDFDRMLGNLQWYAKVVPDLGCSFILDPLNISEIGLAADVLLGAGANFIEYKPKYLPDYRVDEQWLLGQRDYIQSAITRARTAWGPRVMVNSQVDTLLRDQAIPSLTVPARRCLTSSLRMVISSHGCYPCTPHRGVSDRSFGNIISQPLREIVESSRRVNVLGRNCDLRCAYHIQNEYLLGISAGLEVLPTRTDQPTPQDKFI